MDKLHRALSSENTLSAEVEDDMSSLCDDTDDEDVEADDVEVYEGEADDVEADKAVDGVHVVGEDVDDGVDRDIWRR